MDTNNPIVATRTTLDDVRVFVHADGQVSDRSSFLRNRVRRGLWLFVQDICILNYAELELAIKARNRPSRKRDYVIRYDAPTGRIVHDRKMVRY